jgi:opacity protein-like surface antigen
LNRAPRIAATSIKHPICRVLVLTLILAATQAFGQQSYVGRFDAYAGFAYLNSPHIKLAETGFHLQGGVRVTSWLSLGVDFSRAQGDLTIVPSELLTSLQQSLGATLQQYAAAGRLPAGYSLSVPASSTTETFAGGPQVAYRHFSAVTLFIRPSCGAIHEVAVPHVPSTDLIAQGIVALLAPSGKKTDWTKFYGFGGGVDFNLTKHFALRVQADFVHDHLFNDLLKDSRNTVRFSIGPGVQFGGNVKK